MMKKRFGILFLILMVVLAGCAQETEEAPELLVPAGALPDTVTAVMGDMEELDVYEAAVAPAYVELSFPRDTRVGNVHVFLGDAVQAGDPLVSLDVSAIEGQLAALEAERADILAEDEYQASIYAIDTELFSLELPRLSEEEAYQRETDMAIYQQEYQNAADSRAQRLAAIDAEVTALSGQLEDTDLKAPCAGHVTYLGCHAGQTVGAYDTICVVTNDSELTLQSSFISQSAISSAVELYALMDGRRVEIVPLAVNESEYARAMLKHLNYPSSFALQDLPDAKVGQNGVVCLVTKRAENVLKVPLNAVYADGDEHYVYRMDGESRLRQSVEIGLTTSSEAEITSGLQEGDVIYVGN